MAKILIESDGIHGRLYIDGEEVKDVLCIGYSHEGGRIPVLRVDLLADSVSIDSDLVPQLPDIYKPFYKRIADPEAPESAT